MSKFISIAFFATISIFCSVAIAEKSYGSLNVAEVIKVKSGGAFVVNLDYVHPIIAEEITIKVAGIGVPRIKKSRCEKEKAMGLQAKSFTTNFLRNAARIELRNVRRGKNFKIIAEVYGDSVNLAHELIRTQHAYAREPEKVKKDWCL